MKVLKNSLMLSLVVFAFQGAALAQQIFTNPEISEIRQVIIRDGIEAREPLDGLPASGELVCGSVVG